MGAPTSIIRPPRRRIRWRTKHYLSVAMVGALVAIALVAAISISLAPAHLSFSITKAYIGVYDVVDGRATYTHLNFTLLVNNSSPRMSVWYGPMTGEVSYGPAATAWVRYSIPGSDVWHEPCSVVGFDISADYGYSEYAMYAVDSCRMLMVSKVWFAWGGLPTLPYTVRFSCEAVNFKDNSTFPIICA